MVLAGEYITQWKIGTAKKNMVVYTTMGNGSEKSQQLAKVVTPVVALQGITNEGKGLPVAWTEGEWVDEWAVKVAPSPADGFTSLDGNGSGWFMCFLSVGDNHDKKPWSVNGDDPRVGVPGGRVTGYQLRCCGVVEAARFCFRSFPPSIDSSKKLRDWAFISHTGQDPDMGPLAETTFFQLGKRKLTAFFDTEALTAGGGWASKIAMSVRICKVFIILLSPSYPKRFWPMHELDIALNGKPKGGIVIPILLGVERSELENPPPIWQEEWKAIIAKYPDRADKVDIARWARNLKRLTDRQSIEIGALPKGKAMKVANEITQIVSRHISWL